MSDWSTYLNYDIMGDLVFGKRFNCMESTDHRFVPKLMLSATAFIYPVRGGTLFLQRLIDVTEQLTYLPFAALLRPILASPLMTMIGG
jgi:hypothetical protein